jgi:hypothetical protein
MSDWRTEVFYPPDELDANDESHPSVICDSGETVTDLDAALEGQPVEPPALTGAAGRPKCRRHTWRVIDSIQPPEVRCRCGAVRDPAVSRRSANNRKRGNRIQRERIVALGGRNLAGNNQNLDGLGAMFAYESKSGGAFSDRIWRWLTGIPKRGNETAVLIVTDAPGPGHKARSYVVVEYDEWRALHGE